MITNEKSAWDFEGAAKNMSRKWETVFTDDDLKRLKERIKAHPNYKPPSFQVTMNLEEIDALLARLEAAEDAIAHSHGLASPWCCEKAKELDKAWRKARCENEQKRKKSKQA